MLGLMGSRRDSHRAASAPRWAAVSLALVIMCAVTASAVAAGDDNNITACAKHCGCLGDSVNCNKLDLSRVPDDIPTWVERLFLNNNNLTTLKSVVWKSLKKLSRMSLNKNKIQTISKDSFENLEQLQYLELNRNQITNLGSLTFQKMQNLADLKLRRNKISDLSDGAFFGLQRIVSLHLDYNNIQLITKGWMYGLDTLRVLSLSNNLINNIDKDAWEFSRNLVELDLSHNRLRAIKKDTFRELLSLSRLMISHNNITFIEDNAFAHMPNLKILELNSNKISWTIEDASGVFHGLANLNKFYLASNNIKSINKNAFLGLTLLTHLDLNDNNITTIQEYAFSEMPNLAVLVMNTSSLLCDCNLRWFPGWVNEKKIHVSTVCAYPEWLRDQPLDRVLPTAFICDDLPKPRLIVEPDVEIMALMGENISLSCKAMSSSDSPMEFTWKKDNVEMVNPNVTVTGSNESSSGSSARSRAAAGTRNGGGGRANREVAAHLHITHVQHSDAGKYQCVVANTFGATYSQKSSISVLIYPRFVKLPKNITVRAGTTARLECAAHGEPQPEIAWQKDGGNDFPAARERRMHVMPSEDEFFITNVKPSDMGVYSCTAHNAAGSIVHNATLAVEEAPYFVRPMEDHEVMEGESVVIQCMAGGAPKPAILWLKDGVPMVATERHFFTAEEQLMIIVDTVKSDSGVYICQLFNRLGNETSSCKLLVKPVISHSDMLGIIIITVVCCAVCTSFFWVVIIYQTRRRMPLTVLESDDRIAVATRAGSKISDVVSSVVVGTDVQCVGADGRPQQSKVGGLTLLHFDSSRTGGIGGITTIDRFAADNLSEHSSCKDSGTGDSAKRSNDDLLPDEYTLIIRENAEIDTQSSRQNQAHNHNTSSTAALNVGAVDGCVGSTTARAASLYYLMRDYDEDTDGVPPCGGIDELDVYIDASDDAVLTSSSSSSSSPRRRAATTVAVRMIGSSSSSPSAGNVELHQPQLHSPTMTPRQHVNNVAQQQQQPLLERRASSEDEDCVREVSGGREVYVGH